MSEFLLPIFPEGGLSGSIVITVGVGVLVSAFYNLRFGWVLSGFVVPGYIIPLFINRPMIALIDIIEGILTYFIAYYIPNSLHHFKLCSTFFGRDGFYNIFLSSILVRVLFSFFLLPASFTFIYSIYGFSFSYEDNFQSFGIIIIALIANQFWTVGFKKGLVPFFVTLMTTYVLIRYGFMEWTNLRISEIGYLYDAALYNFFGSYKAYVILLVTALIASRMNLKYGWEYGGILLAALLALQWYFPVKLLITLAEAILIYSISRSVLKIPFFETANISRAREVVLFFRVGFVYKVIFSWIMFFWFFDINAGDLYGFGYLLSSFIAIKMYNSQMPIRVLSAIVQTSFVGFILGTIISILLTLIPYPESISRFFPAEANIEITTYEPDFLQKPVLPKKIESTNGYLSDFITERSTHFAEAGTNLYKPPSKDDLHRFDNHVFTPLITLIDQGITLPKLEALNRAAATYGYEIRRFNEKQNSYLILTEDENSKQRHYGATFIFRLQESSPYIFQIPHPLLEINTAEAGLYLFSRLKGKAFIFTEAHPQTNFDDSADPIKPTNKNSFFHLGAQVMLREAGDNPLMLVYLRGYSPVSSFIPFKGSSSEADIFLAFDNGAIRNAQLTSLQKILVDELKRENLKILFVDNAEETQGYGMMQIQELQYLNQTKNKELTLVWLSSSQRGIFRNPEHEFLRLSHMTALNIPIEKTTIDIFKNVNTGNEVVLSKEALSSLQKYIETEDILYLSTFQNLVLPHRLVYVVDPSLQKSFLAVVDKGIINLFPLKSKNSQISKKEKQ
jgi:hypothetical protein